MTVDALIRRAREAIGEQAEDDYILAPSSHARLLKEGAPGLAALLERSNLDTLAKEYERLDREAGAAQTRFKTPMRRANLAVLVAGALSAATMAIGVLHEHLGPRFADVLLVLCGVGALLCGALAAALIYQVREGKLLEAWGTKRADAETARLDYFNELLRTEGENELLRSEGSAAGGGAGDAPLPLLKLEYFRRYQLDVQRAYYGQRSQQHAASARQTLMWGSIAAFAGALSGGAAGVLGITETALTALGGLGVLGTALAAYAAAREAMNQDRRNAERYERTHAALTKLRAKLDEVRDAAAAGQLALVEEFAAAVHEQLSLEHRQWREAGESSDSAAARLERALADQRKKPQTVDG
jgi:hypothetical protein